MWDGGNPSYFKTPQNTTLNIDLNGYTISRLSHDNKGNVATIANPDSHVKIYSSRPGAKIFNASLTTSNGVVNGGAVVSAGGQNSSATFGNGTNNLSIYTAILVDAAHYVSRGAAETTKNIVKINIDGGLYVRSHADSYALIIARDDVEINFKNATIASTTGPIISRDNRYNGSITGTIDNCKLSSAKIVDQIDDSSITITKSVLSGAFVASDASNSGGKVYLGDGTKYGMTLPETVAIADGAIAFGKTETVTFNWTTYNFAYDKTTNKVLPDSITPVAKSDTVNATVEIMSEDRAPKEITVYWYTDKGIPLGSQTAYEGETATFTGEYPETRINGWFVSGIAGWSNTPGGEAVSTVVSQSNCRFYAVLGSAINVQFLHNLTTTTNFTRNVYLPVPAEGSGIVITGVYSGTDLNGTNLYGAYRCDPTKVVSINGEKYLAIVDWPGANNNGAAIAYTVTYTYNGVAASTYVKAPSFVDYFTQVLESEDMDEEGRTLVINIANYLKAIASYANLSFAGQYDELLTQYSEYVIEDIDDMIAADATKNPANVSALSSYITGATFVIGTGYRPMFGFVPASGVELVKVTLNSNSGVVKSFSVNKPTNNNWGTDRNILVNNMDIPVYDIRETITITSSDGKATGTYNLAAYITWMQGEVDNNTANADADALAVAKTLYAYSVASYEYKTRNAGK